MKHLVKEHAGGELVIYPVSTFLEIVALEIHRPTTKGTGVALLTLEQLDATIAALRDVRDQVTVLEREGLGS